MAHAAIILASPHWPRLVRAADSAHVPALQLSATTGSMVRICGQPPCLVKCLQLRFGRDMVRMLRSQHGTSFRRGGNLPALLLGDLDESGD